MNRSWIYGLATVAVMASVSASAAQSAALVINTPLRQSPDNTAAVVANLNKDAVVSVLDRSGGWYSVETAQAKGWLRIVALRFVGAAPVKTAQVLPGTGSHNDGNITVATGIRGLSDQDLASAKPDHAALAAVSAYSVDNEEVNEFVREGGLTPGATP